MLSTEQKTTGLSPPAPVRWGQKHRNKLPNHHRIAYYQVPDLDGDQQARSPGKVRLATGNLSDRIEAFRILPIRGFTPVGMTNPISPIHGDYSMGYAVCVQDLPIDGIDIDFEASETIHLTCNEHDVAEL